LELLRDRIKVEAEAKVEAKAKVEIGKQKKYQCFLANFSFV